MKRVFVVHGWEATPNDDWFPWLKEELTKKGFEVAVLAMPNTNNPKMAEWVSFLSKAVGNPTHETYFVGHSTGCITILRYLESLGKGDVNVGGVVLVAGFASDVGFKELESFIQTPLNWSKVKVYCKKFVAINSDNDPVIPLVQGKVFRDKLGAEFIVEHNKGHFNASDGITKLPSVLNAILEMSSHRNKSKN